MANKKNTTLAHLMDAMGRVLSALGKKQDKLTFDTAPTDGSQNPITSDAVHDALQQALDPVATDDGAGNVVLTMTGADPVYSYEEGNLTIN